MHVLGNDPRPHYVHQSSLTEDRILYSVADGVLTQVRRYFNTATTPLGNPTLREAGTELKNRSAFSRGRARVEGYVQAGTLTLSLTGTGEGVPVPVTAQPSLPIAALANYWGLRNGWQDVGAGRPVQIPLAASVPYGR